MSYSTDLRKRFLDFIKAGGSKAEACRQFSVSGATLYKWLNASDPFAYQTLREISGASLMFLPPHSHDDKPMEHDFANIKRSREYQPETSLEQIIQMYQEF